MADVDPATLVATDDEQMRAIKLYGFEGARNGMMHPRPIIMGGMVDPVCRSQGKPETREFAVKCGPFKADYYGAPLAFPDRYEDTSDLPAR